MKSCGGANTEDDEFADNSLAMALARICSVSMSVARASLECHSSAAWSKPASLSKEFEESVTGAYPTGYWYVV